MNYKINNCKNDKDKAAIIEDLKFYKIQVETRDGLMLSKHMNVVKKCKEG